MDIKADKKDGQTKRKTEKQMDRKKH